MKSTHKFFSLTFSLCVCLSLMFVSADSRATISFVTSATTEGNDDRTDIDVPSGVLADDLLLAQITYRDRGGGDDVFGPSGWTRIGSLERDDDILQAIYYRIATNGESGTNYEWDFQGGGDRRFVTGMSVFRGVDTSDPIADDNAQDGLSSFTVTAPSVNVANANSALVAFYTIEAGNQSFTATASMSEIYDEEEHNTGNGVTSMAAYELNVPAGASGSRTATSTRNNDDANGFLIALNPGSVTFPSFSSVDGACGANQVIIVEFSSDVTDDALNSSLYTLSNGAVTGVSRQSSNTVVLSASGLVPGDAVSLDLQGQSSGVNFQGILGQYFDQRNGSGNKVDEPAGFLTGNEFYRLDPQIDFDFGTSTPAIFPNVSGNNERFSIRWAGSLVPDVSGSFEFRMRSDDGVILNLEGAEILRDFSRHAPRFSSASPAQVLLAGESYDIEMLYFEHTGQAVAELEWRRDGGAWEVIPTANLNTCASASSTFPDIAFWDFNQSEWTGAADEVLDSGPNAYHGTAVNGATTEFVTPAIATDPGTCQYGVFDDAGPTTGNYIEVPNFPNLTTDFTITAWIRTQDRAQRGQRIFADDESGPGYSLSLGDPGAGRMRFFSRGIGPVSLDTNEVIQNDTWYFVAGVADITNRVRTIYVFADDGTLLETASVSHTGNWAVSNGMASIGGETNSGESNNRFNGNIDSVRITSGALTQSDIESLRAVTQPCGVFSPVLEYRFDEFLWDGTANEVGNEAGSGGNGVAVGGAVTIPDGQICYAGQFDGIDDYVDVGAGTLSALQSTASLSFWIQTTQTGDNTAWRAPGVTGIEQAGGSDDIFWGWIDAGGRIGVAVANDFNTNTRSATAINDGVFHHVVLTRDASTGAFKIYVDGVLERNAVGQAGDIGNSFSSIGRIEDTGGTPAYFRGVLDEIRVYDTILDDQAVLDLFNDTRECADACVLDSLRVTQPASGLACPQTRASVVIEALCADGSVSPTYAGTVNLLTSDDANSEFYDQLSGGNLITSIDFVPADAGTKTVYLFHSSEQIGADAVVVNVEDGTLMGSGGGTQFAAEGFAVATNGQPSNFMCGNSTTTTIVAIGQDESATGCSPLTNFSGNRSLQITSDINIDPLPSSPASGLPNSILVNGAPVTGAVSANFTNGQTTLNIEYLDVGRISNMTIRHDQTPYDGGAFQPLETVLDAFVAYPQEIEVSADSSSAACDPADPVSECSRFVPAQSDFSITTRAICADGDAITPATTAQSFVGEVDLTHSVVEPSTGIDGNLGVSDLTFDATGAITTSNQTISEVGVFRLTASPQAANYFGAPLNSGTSDLIGRFIPDSFNVSISPSSFANACDPDSPDNLDGDEFTYLGQSFQFATAPRIEVQAINTDGGITQNYEGDFWRLGNFVQSTDCGVAAGFCYENNVTGQNLTVPSASAPVFDASDANGERVINGFHSGEDFRYEKGTTPIVPFDADIRFRVRFEDSDGVVGSAQIDRIGFGFDSDLGSGSELNVTSDDFIRYGRFRLENVFGPETEDLLMPSQLEYFDRTANSFILNAEDNCTSIQSELMVDGTAITTAGQLLGINLFGNAFTDFTYDAPVSGGLANFAFSGPDDADALGQSVDVTLDFSSSAPWLLFDWDPSSSGLENPPTRSASFGQFRGHDRIIYWREVR